MSLSDQDRVEKAFIGPPVGDQAACLLDTQKQRVVGFLKQNVDPSAFEMWFDGGDCIQVKSQFVEIVAASDFQLHRLQSRHAAVFRKAARFACGENREVRFRLDKKRSRSTAKQQTLDFESADSGDVAQTNGSAKSNSGLQAVAAKPRGIGKPNRKGLESFWFGESNKFAEAAIEQLKQQPGQVSPLVFYGPTGCGKSHLLGCLTVDARRKLGLKRAVQLTAERFTTDFVEALRGTGLPVFRRKYRDLDLLAIDDIQFFGGKSATLAEFQYTIDVLIRNGKQVVLTSDRPPADLGSLGADVNGRLVSGLACPLNYPDVAGRKQILAELSRERKLAIPNDVLELVGRGLSRDVRRLSGAVNRLHAWSVAMGRDIDVELARQALTDLFSLSASQSSIGTIEDAVCSFCGVQPGELKSTSRRKKIAAARMLAMYLSRKYTPKAFSEIGDYFGRSHSTVIAANKKVARWFDSDEPIELPHARYSTRDAIVQIESSLRIS